MAKTSTKPPSGMRDFLPRDMARRHYVTSIVRNVYERYGFQPLETPAIENLPVLLGKYGEDEKLIYRLLHRGEALQRAIEHGATEAGLSDLALRYDLTVPLARVVAEHGQLPKYFKRYQIQPVWRADRPGKGRFREFYQCDVDAIGTESLVAEAEVTAAVAEVLSRLGFDDYVIRLNHRALLRGLVEAAGISLEHEGKALVAVDKIDKIGAEGVLAELSSRGIDTTAGKKLLSLLDRAHDVHDDRAVLERLRAALGGREPALAAVGQLEELLDLTAVTPAAGRVRFAPDLARGLSYYTGAIFEVTLGDFGSSVAGGGRYDDLVGMFGKQRVPAVGFAIGLERVLTVMDERGLFPELLAGPQVILCWVDVPMAEVLRVAHVLRGHGLHVDVFPEASKLGRQLQYAASEGVGAPFAAILGEDELRDGMITLKYLPTGDQQHVILDKVGQRIAERTVPRTVAD